MSANWKCWLSAAGLLGLGACAMQVEGVELDEGEPDVAVTRQALGDPSQLVRVRADRTLSMSPLLGLFKLDRGESCSLEPEVVRAVRLSNGDQLDVSFGCRTVGTAYAPIFLYASDVASDDILVSQSGEAPVKLVDTVGDPTGKIEGDNYDVYWSDGNGLRKVARTGGAITTLVFKAGVELLGIDGSLLFYKRWTGTDVTELHSVSTSGRYDTLLHSTTAPLAYQDLSFDASYFYWVENSSTTRVIRRLPRSGGTATQLYGVIGASVRYPIPTSSGLFFTQSTSSSTKIRQRRSSGSVADEITGLLPVSGMSADATYLYYVENDGLYRKISRAVLRL